MRKKFLVILTLVLILSFSLGAVAGSNLQEVIVVIDYGMKMFLNGQPFNPTDVQTGTAYRPIIYKNKIYLPAREICDASKLAINYDSKANALYIGENLNYIEVKAEDFEKHFNTAYTKDADLLFTPSKTYKYGIVKTLTASDMYGAKIKPGGKYSKFKTALYLGEGESKSVTFEFKNLSNNELLKAVTIKAGETVDIEFSVIGVESFSVMHQGFHENHRIILGEPQFK